MKNKEPLALIMKGGGIKGLAYVGALEELNKFYNFNWFVGTSAGAISAILLASGYSLEELNDILITKDFRDFKDANFFRKILNLFTKKGFYEANTFTIWLDTLLAKKLNSPVGVTLEDLPKRVTVYASRKGDEALIYDSNDPSNSKIRAAFAARCSMSIPFFFTPQQSEGLNVFDGGAQNNYPVEILLRSNPDTNFIGLYLGPEHFEGQKKKSVLGDLLSIWTESSDITALKKHKDKTVIIDPRPISTLKFNLNNEEKQFLLESGKIAALKFLIKKGKINENEIDLDQKINNHEKNRKSLNRIVKRKSFRKKIIIWIVIIFAAIFCYFKYFDNREANNPNIESFSVTVLVHGKDGKDDRILRNQGKVVLDFGTTREEESINEKGEATFKELPIGFESREALISIAHPQPYFPTTRNEKYVLEKDEAIYLEVELTGIDKIFGTVLDFTTEQPLDSVRVSVKDAATSTDKFGWFELDIPPKYQAKIIRVTFLKDGYIVTTDTINPHTNREIDINLKRY